MAGSAYNVQRAVSALSLFLALAFLFTLYVSLSPESYALDYNVLATGVKGSESSIFNSTAGGMENKLFVILVAGFRTGSTLLGNFFNENPDVVYIFEPLHKTYLYQNRDEIPGYTPGMAIDKLQLLYLEKLLQNCVSYYPPYFWKQMKHLRCKDEEESLRKFGNTDCKKPKGYLTDLCNKLDTTVVKTIRLIDIGDLGKIDGIENLNFKVIHLLRDPRGTVNSRWHGFLSFYLKDRQIPVEPVTNDKIRMVANDYCERELHNVILTDENMPEWLKGKYLRVTHTQMSLDPSGWLEKIYKWLDIPLPQSVRNYVTEIEKSTNVANLTRHSDLLNVKKNSKAVLEKWGNDLTPEWVQIIQETCKDLMSRLNMTLVQ